MHYIPMNFGEAPDYYRRFIAPPEVVASKACPMDEHGYFNFSASVAYTKALTERAKVLIVETSPRLPYVYGGEESVHASEVDFVIEGEDAAPPTLVNPEPSPVDLAVAKQIAAEIEDGACLQIGIGAMPNAVCTALRTAGHRDLGFHTEMMVDGMIDLIESGIVTGARKTLNRFQSVFTFACVGGGKERRPRARGRHACEGRPRLCGPAGSRFGERRLEVHPVGHHRRWVWRS